MRVIAVYLRTSALSVLDVFCWPMPLCTQLGVVAKLKERGKEISNDSVAEKMLDL